LFEIKKTSVKVDTGKYHLGQDAKMGQTASLKSTESGFRFE